MKVIYGIGHIKKIIHDTVLVIGIFDGLHLGHQQLIKKAVKKAKAIGAKAGVLTFHPHPVHVLYPQAALPYIMSLEYRLRMIQQMGVDYIIVEKFTKKFASMSPKKFIDDYLIKFIRLREIIVGEDFRFGKDRSGTLEYFSQIAKKRGYKVSAIEAIKGGSKKIGSTVIRRHIAEGNLKKAQKLLGRPVSVMGLVEAGEKRGKSLGFPTANIYPEEIVLPPLGVYAVYVNVEGKKYKGMANLGRRPSFGITNNPINIEVNLFNFNKNIYGKEIVVEFIKRIRDEKKFNREEKLIQQLKRDRKKAMSILN